MPRSEIDRLYIRSTVSFVRNWPTVFKVAVYHFTFPPAENDTSVAPYSPPFGVASALGFGHFRCVLISPMSFFSF